MLDAATLLFRHKQVLGYLEQYQSIGGRSWVTFANEAADFPARLLLIHPNWLPDKVLIPRIQGQSRFALATLEVRCRAEEIWGYYCPLVDEPLQADHVFPYALGGPTNGGNLLQLCRLHNSWKGSDLMAFPWEMGEPPWLTEQIDVMHYWMNR